jgi:CheY-like chemotaxis protein
MDKALGKRWLVVEDSDDDVYLLQRAIRQGSLPVLVLHSSHGLDAIDYLRKALRCQTPACPLLPDLILLDVRMPIMGGFQFLDWVKANPLFRHLPVVVWSSSRLDCDKDKARELGAVNYLVKPSLPRGYMQLVSELMVG